MVSERHFLGITKVQMALVRQTCIDLADELRGLMHVKTCILVRDQFFCMVVLTYNPSVPVCMSQKSDLIDKKVTL